MTGLRADWFSLPTTVPIQIIGHFLLQRFKKKITCSKYVDLKFYDSWRTLSNANGRDKHNFVLDCFETNSKAFGYNFDKEKCKYQEVEDAPQQIGLNCGAHVIMTSEYICMEQKIDFTAKDMAYFRHKIALQVIQGTLILRHK